ncbi:MAG: SH3 domain-containing protein [Treponemataceae bacterium]
MGYSVVLWSIPEENISDGSIVPVYIRSNIMQCYVIGIPETKKKCEIPIWQITKPVSRLKVKNIKQKYSEYSHKYAMVKRDGLPIRQDPQNTARQVYRTREGEVIKVLFKGKGAEVLAGKNSLEGDWLKVLTQDGTSGWCFSYNLELFDDTQKKMDPQAFSEQEQENSAENTYENQDQIYDEFLVKILSKTWYPEEYRKMVKNNRIDLEVFNPEQRFDTGFLNKEVSLNLEETKISFDFNGLTKTEDSTYNFNDSTLTMTIKSEDSILLQYTNQSGKNKSFYLVSLAQDIYSIIENEKTRRNAEYSKILNAGTVFHSSNYGTLHFKSGNIFEWNNYGLLSPSLIPQNSGNYGSATLDFFISNSVKKDFDGVITFKFEKSDGKINFLYKIEENGIRLEDAQKARYNGKLILERSSNPVVMFFAK